MHVYINERPSRLTRDKGLFSVKNDTEELRLSPYQVRSFCLTRACMVSSDAMLLAMKHQIPIILLDYSGRPAGQLWSHRYGSIATIRRQQVLFSQSEAAGTWWIDRLEQKALAQIRLLEPVAKQKGKRAKQLSTHLENMKLHRDQLQQFPKPSLKSNDDALRGIEGNLAQHYYKGLNLLLPKAYRFETRSRRPAKDLFNAALNYGYGMLYNLINTALLTAGLDPYLAIFHREEHNRAALGFDFIEPYRPWADEVITGLCLSEKLQIAHSQPVKGGIWLNAEGRRIVIEAMNTFLDDKIYANQRRLARRLQVHEDATALAQQLLKHPL